MKERPILFFGPMVSALLAGTKTQTRRVVKPQPVPDGNGGASWYGRGVRWAGKESNLFKAEDCPYGQPGDRLWVRETWAQNWNQLSDTRMDRSYVYRADGEQRAQDNGTDLPWRPSIHMPRRASRITLEVTGVRVERLQDISEADSKAEGAVGHPDGPWHAYRSLWTLINGPGSWDANPWVWVVEFKTT